MSVESSVFERVTALLGRRPRGLEEIAVWSDSGDPAVIRVSSLVDEKPFPTLYWLIDPALCYAIDQVEAGGLIQTLQMRVNEDSGLQQTMRADHRAHIVRRAGFISAELWKRITALGYEAVFETKGIGGISDFTRIRCLHTWYAAHLVEANAVGRLLDEYWSAERSRA